MLKKLSFNYISGQESSSNGMDFVSFIKVWPKMVGQLLAENSTPLKIKNDTLMIVTRHSIFSHELKSLSHQIILNIAKHYPSYQAKIKRLSFVNDEAFFMKKEIKAKKSEAKKSSLHPYSPLYKKLKKEALELTQDIEDKAMREHWISIYLQVMAP